MRLNSVASNTKLHTIVTIYRTTTTIINTIGMRNHIYITSTFSISLIQLFFSLHQQPCIHHRRSGFSFHLHMYFQFSRQTKVNFVKVQIIFNTPFKINLLCTITVINSTPLVHLVFAELGYTFWLKYSDKILIKIHYLRKLALTNILNSTGKFC